MSGLIGVSGIDLSQLPPDLLQGLISSPPQPQGLVAAPPPAGIVSGTPQGPSAQAAAPPPPPASANAVTVDGSGNIVSGPSGAGAVDPTQAAPPLPQQQPGSNPFLDVVRSAGDFAKGLIRLPIDYVGALGAGLEAVPQNIAFELAQRRLQMARMEALFQRIGQMSPQDQVAALTNPEKLGEAYASGDTATTLSEGQGRFDPVRGTAFTQPKMSIEAGTPVTQTPTSTFASGPRLPGKVTAANGLVIDENNPTPVATYSTPQAVPITSRGLPFTPTVTGPDGQPMPIPQRGDAAPFAGPGAPNAPAAAPGPIVPQLGANNPPAPPAPPIASPLAAIRANPAGFFGKVFGAPVTITSGARSPARNAAVGGSPTSEHLTGSAWDIAPPPGMTTAQAAMKLASAGLPFDQVIDEGTHVHFGLKPNGPQRGQVLQATGKGGYRRLGGPGAQPIPQAGGGAPAQGPAGFSPNWSGGIPSGANVHAPGVWTPQEATAAGYPPGAVVVTQPDGTTSVQVQRAATALPDEDQKTLNDLRTESIKLARLAATARQFSQLQASGHVDSGNGYAIPGVNDVRGAMDPNVANLNGLSKQMIPLQREIGQGPIRLGEIQGPGGGLWGGDIPDLKRPSEANSAMAQNWGDIASQYSRYIQFKEQWAQTHGTLNGSDEAWAAQNGGTMFQLPETLDPKDPQGSFGRLAPGSLYRGPDGRLRRK